MTIPVVAAMVGYGTNWVGVKMIFYPIDFWGVDIKRWNEQPLGLFGWQGIVPCKTNKMSRRLVDIITTKLLSLKEAFGRLDATKLAELLEPRARSCMEPWLKETAVAIATRGIAEGRPFLVCSSLGVFGDGAEDIPAFVLLELVVICNWSCACLL